MMMHPLGEALGLDIPSDFILPRPEKWQLVDEKRYNSKGPFNGNYGMKHSEESKKIMSDKKKGMMQMKDSKTGKSVGLVSKKHPKYISGEYVHINKNAKRSEEFKKHRSDLYKEKGHKPSTTHKGTYWWTNGKETMRSTSCPGDGWKRGRK